MEFGREGDLKKKKVPITKSQPKPLSNQCSLKPHYLRLGKLKTF